MSVAEGSAVGGVDREVGAVDAHAQAAQPQGCPSDDRGQLTGDDYPRGVRVDVDRGPGHDATVVVGTNFFGGNHHGEAVGGAAVGAGQVGDAPEGERSGTGAERDRDRADLAGRGAVPACGLGFAAEGDRWDLADQAGGQDSGELRKILLAFASDQAEGEARICSACRRGCRGALRYGERHRGTTGASAGQVNRESA